MNRRDLLRLVSLLPSAPHVYAEPANAIQVKRRLDVAQDRPDLRLIQLEATTDMLYAVYTTTTGVSVAAFDRSGQRRFDQPLLLPVGSRFVRLNAHPSGQLSVVQYSPTDRQQEAVQYTSTLARISSRKLEATPVVSCVTTGETLVGMFSDGSLGVSKLSGRFNQTAGVMPPVVIGNYTPPVPAMFIEPLGSSKLAVASKTTARIAIVSVANGRVQIVRPATVIDDPDVRSSLASARSQVMGNPQRQENGRTISPGVPNVIHLMVGTQDGTIYCMLSPIQLRQGPLVLKLSETGAMLQRLRCQLPLLDDGVRRAPMTMRVFGSELMLGLSKGQIISYSVV